MFTNIATKSTKTYCTYYWRSLIACKTFAANYNQLNYGYNECDKSWVQRERRLHTSRAMTANTSESNDRKSGDNSEDNVIRYTTSDAHLKHKSYRNFRCNPLALSLSLSLSLSFSRNTNDILVVMIGSDEEVLDTPWYERPILVLTSAVFFVYFAYLREPNDMDAKMGRDLFEVMPGLEIPLIESAIAEAQRMGSDTRQLRHRLNELKALKARVDQLDHKPHN